MKEAVGCEVKQQGPEKITRETRKADCKWRKARKHVGRRRRCLQENIEGASLTTGARWQCGVGSGRQEAGRGSQGLYTDAIYHVSYCEGNMKDCLSNTQHSTHTGSMRRSRAGEQEMVRQEFNCDTWPHLVSEMSSGKTTQVCTWITSQALSTHGGSFHFTPFHTITVFVHWKTDDCKEKSSLGHRKPLGKEEQVLRGCKGWD